MANKKSTLATASTASMVQEVCAQFQEIPKKVTKQLIYAFIEAIEGHVASGEKVRIDKIGILSIKDRAARTGRNPQTGEAIKIPEAKRVAFKVSTSLKERAGIKKKNANKKK